MFGLSKLLPLILLPFLSVCAALAFTFSRPVVLYYYPFLKKEHKNLPRNTQKGFILALSLCYLHYLHQQILSQKHSKLHRALLLLRHSFHFLRRGMGSGRGEGSGDWNLTKRGFEIILEVRNCCRG